MIAYNKNKNMKETYYCHTKLIQKVVDKVLLGILTNHSGIQSFSEVLKTIANDLIVLIEDGGKNVLSVKSKENDGLLKVLNLYFYLQALLSNNMIIFITTACDDNKVELGDNNLNKEQPGYLPEEVSNFFKEHITDNLCVSSAFSDYVEAGHVSLELYEVRKNTKIAQRSSWAAIVSALIALATLFCKMS